MPSVPEESVVRQVRMPSFLDPPRVGLTRRAREVIEGRVAVAATARRTGVHVWGEAALVEVPDPGGDILCLRLRSRCMNLHVEVANDNGALAWLNIKEAV